MALFYKNDAQSTSPLINVILTCENLIHFREDKKKSSQAMEALINFFEVQNCEINQIVVNYVFSINVLILNVQINRKFYYPRFSIIRAYQFPSLPPFKTSVSKISKLLGHEKYTKTVAVDQIL